MHGTGRIKKGKFCLSFSSKYHVEFDIWEEERQSRPVSFAKATQIKWYKVLAWSQWTNLKQVACYPKKIHVYCLSWKPTKQK